MIKKMTIDQLVTYAKENNIDISKVHTGNSFVKIKGKKFKKLDLLECINGQIDNDKSNVMDEPIEEKLKDLDTFQFNIDRIANDYYDYLYQYSLELLSQQIAFSPSFFKIVSKYAETVKNQVSSVKKSNDISGNTLKNYHCQIMILIENKVLENKHKFEDDLLLKTFNVFVDSTKNIFSVDFKKAITTTGNHLNERQNDFINIYCKDLIKFAQTTLEKLSDDSRDWKKIALSLMVVTGRRLTEIMFSASFDKVDDYHVNFTGQLKGTQYDTKSYQIPTLAKSDDVINGIEWLKLFGKRNNNDFIELVNNKKFDFIKLQNKKTHGQYARYLNEEVKNLFDEYITLDDGDSWIIKFNDGKEKDRRTTHLCRQLYAQIAWYLFYYTNDSNRRKKHQILADIMGHEYSSEKTRTASNNYDADFEIKDYEEISKLINI